MEEQNEQANLSELAQIDGYYAVEDRWARKGDVLVLENVDALQEDGTTKRQPRIVARFYGFSPSGADLEASPEDNVAHVMAHMFVTMSNDGFAAVKRHMSRKVDAINPARRIVRPGEL